MNYWEAAVLGAFKMFAIYCESPQISGDRLQHGHPSLAQAKSLQLNKTQQVHPPHPFPLSPAITQLLFPLFPTKSLYRQESQHFSLTKHISLKRYENKYIQNDLKKKGL